MQSSGESYFSKMIGAERFAADDIAGAQSPSDLELLAAEARAACAGHPRLPQFEAIIAARQRLLARAQALLDEIACYEPGEEDRW